MTIQPLVENAIHHAAEKMLDVCVIRVSGAATADGVDIIVQDNGPRTDEDILNKLESGEVQPEGLGIGMRNIHKRVHTPFPSSMGCVSAVRRAKHKLSFICRIPGLSRITRRNRNEDTVYKLLLVDDELSSVKGWNGLLIGKSWILLTASCPMQLQHWTA